MPSPERKGTVTYIVGFAAAVCLVCGVLVAGVAVSLKELQDENQRVDRMRKVLEVAGLVETGENVTAQEIISRFDANIALAIICPMA